MLANKYNYTYIENLLKNEPESIIISDVLRKIGCSREHLYNFIIQKYGRNFFDLQLIARLKYIKKYPTKSVSSLVKKFKCSPKTVKNIKSGKKRPMPLKLKEKIKELVKIKVQILQLMYRNEKISHLAIKEEKLMNLVKIYLGDNMGSYIYNYASRNNLKIF